MSAPAVRLSPDGRVVVDLGRALNAEGRRWLAVWSEPESGLCVHLHPDERVADWPEYREPASGELTDDEFAKALDLCGRAIAASEDGPTVSGHFLAQLRDLLTGRPS